MRVPIPCRIQRCQRYFIAIALAILATSCERKPPVHEAAPLTADETYLVESYANIRYAESLYRADPARAESLFTALSTSVDSVRIARTIDAINRTPARWIDIFDEIEKTIRNKRTKSPH